METETLRSTFLPEDVMSGTKMFLNFYEGKRHPYVVETRFQVLKRAGTIKKAIAYWEKAELGDI